MDFTAIETLSYPALFSVFFFYTLKTNKEREVKLTNLIESIIKDNTKALQQNTHTLNQLIAYIKANRK